MARVPACGIVPERLKRVGGAIIMKLGISPPARVRESLGIFLDERNRFQDVRHHHEIGDSALFFAVHSIFTILEPSGNVLPLPGVPCRYALIIAVFAAITFNPFSV